jgi:hypothetical protein
MEDFNVGSGTISDKFASFHDSLQSEYCTALTARCSRLLTLWHWGQRHIAIEKYLSMMEDHQATTYKTDCKKMRATSASPLGALPVQQEGWELDRAVRATEFGGAGEVRTVDVQPLLRAAQKSRSMAQTYLLECAQAQAEEEMRLEALEEGDESDGELGIGVAGEEATGAKEDQSEEEVQCAQEGKGYEGSGDDGGMDEDAAADCACRGEDRVLAPGDIEKRDWVVTPVKGFCAAEEPDLPEAAGGVGPMRQQEAQGLKEMGAEGQKGGGEARDFTPAKEARRRHCLTSGIPTTPPRFPSSLAPEQVQHAAEKSESNAGGHGRDGRPPRRWIVDAKQGTRWDCAPSLLGGMRSGVLEPSTGYDTEITGEGEGGGGGNAVDQDGETLGDGERGRACEGVHLPSTPAGARKSAPNGVVSRVRTTQFVTEALAAHSRDARRVCLRAQGFVTPKTKDRVEEWVRVHVPLGEDHPECRTLFRASSDSPCKSPLMPTDGEARAHTLVQEWQLREAAHCEEGGWDGDDAESCGVDLLGGTEADDLDAMRREEEDKVTPLKSEVRCGTVKRWARDAFAGDFGEIQGDFDDDEEGQGGVQAHGAGIVPCGRKHVVGLRAEHDEEEGQGEVQLRGTGIVPLTGKVVGLGAEVRRDCKTGQVVSGIWIVGEEGDAGLRDGCGEEDTERWWEVEGEWSAGARGVEAAGGSEGRLPTDALLQHALQTYTQAAAREDSAEEVEEDLIVEEEEEEEEEEEKVQDIECKLHGQGEGRCKDIASQELCTEHAEEEEAVPGFSRNRTVVGKRLAAPLALELEADVGVKGEESTVDEVGVSSAGSAASHKSTKSSGERRREAWEAEQQVCDLDPAHTSPTSGPRQHKRYKKSSRGTDEGRMRSGGKYLGHAEDKEKMSPQLAGKSQHATISAKRLTPCKAQVGQSQRREGEDAEGEEGWEGNCEAPPPQTPSPISLRSALRTLRCE